MPALGRNRAGHVGRNQPHLVGHADLATFMVEACEPQLGRAKPSHSADNPAIKKVFCAPFSKKRR
jgi:hypothetical protein